MEITVSVAEARVPVTVLAVAGPIVTTDELQQRATQEIDAGARNILVDLDDVPYMATAGLRALHQIFTLLRTANSEQGQDVSGGIAAGTFMSPHLKLLNPSKNTREALHVAGYDMFLEIYDDRKQALASF